MPASGESHRQVGRPGLAELIGAPVTDVSRPRTWQADSPGVTLRAGRVNNEACGQADD